MKKLILFICMLSFLSCSTSRIPYKQSKKVWNCASSNTEMYYGTIVDLTVVTDSEAVIFNECNAVTTLYTTINSTQPHPFIIKICGYHSDIDIGKDVWIYHALPMNFYDHNKYVVIEGYRYNMLE